MDVDFSSFNEEAEAEAEDKVVQHGVVQGRGVTVGNEHMRNEKIKHVLQVDEDGKAVLD